MSPTAGTTTRSDLKTLLNSRTGGKNDQLTDIDTLLDSAVRFVLMDLDLRGMKRRTALAPDLFDDIFDHTLPTDFKAFIDIAPQVNREELTEWDLVREEEFDRKKTRLSNLVSYVSDDLTPRLRVSKKVDDESTVLGRMESLGGDGDTWVGFASTGDSDGEAVTDSDVKKDGSDFVKGNASIRFADNGDTDATLVGLENRGLDQSDLSDFVGTGSIFVRGRLTTGDTDITQLNVRIGSDSSNYYLVSDSTTNENTPFETGWNLVRLDMSGRSTVGTPTDSAMDYLAAYWTKTANTHLTDTDYAFDHIEIKKGVIHELVYYSLFVWQTASTVAYKETSTADTDTLSLYSDEIELVVAKAMELAGFDLSDNGIVERGISAYQRLRQVYLKRYPSEAKTFISMPYEFGTVVGTRDFRSQSDSSST